jgi:hypothetical protein
MARLTFAGTGIQKGGGALLWIRVFLLIALTTQILWHARLAPPSARAERLPEPLPAEVLRWLSFGEEAVLSRGISLWLQAFDNQPGINIPFARLNYDQIVAWLEASLALDHKNTYPLLVASTLYSDVADSTKVRTMLEFIDRQFALDPDQRWRWMAHAVLVAKHRLRDLAFAHRLADRLARLTGPDYVPGWARQMRIFLLEDLGEKATAAALIGALLESGQITSSQEIAFLSQRLDDLTQDIDENETRE